MVTRRFLISALLMTAAIPVLAEAPGTSLRPKKRPLRGAAKVKAEHPQKRLQQIVTDARLSGSVSIAVADNSGRILESLTPNKSLPPASVAKAVTALYALQHLGSDFRYVTSVIATGSVQGGIVQGDLVVVGGGDPHMDSDLLSNLASGLVQQGITGITGSLFVYGGALPYQRVIDRAQPDHVSYNPSLSGLNLNFNRVYFEWKRTVNGYSVTMDARTNRMRPLVRDIKMSIVNRKEPLFTYQDSDKMEQWSVMRDALGKGGGRWLPVRDIDTYVGEVFRSVAAKKGVRLPKAKAVKVLPNGKIIAQEVSQTLFKQSKAMLKFSTNLTAEVMGLTATQRRRASVKTLEASGKEMAAWVKQAYGVSGLKFVDHSGLGDSSRVSADQMLQVLARSSRNLRLRSALKTMKLVNSKGRSAPIDGVTVFAKTGTLNFVSALAGYIDTPNGHKLTFAIFTADISKRSKINKEDRERPAGSKTWRNRSKTMQQKLLRRWVLEYGVSS
jgi:D-alanyl-D-alanine carboxypeptidase/D-alanyl-D-alanine-endopeptidase (penicillin-binding protein 4)